MPEIVVRDEFHDARWRQTFPDRWEISFANLVMLRDIVGPGQFSALNPVK